MTTLSNIVSELKTQNEISEQILEQQGVQSALLTDMMAGQSSAERLQALEDKGEIQNKVGLRPSGATVAGTGDSANAGIFAGIGSFLGNILSGPLKFLLTPIKALARFLRVGGPVALIIGGLYTLFKDIGENENFQKTMDGLSEAWDSIKETWSGIVKKFEELSADPGLMNAVTMIKTWFGDLKKNIQDFVLENLLNITTTIAGVLDGIEDLIGGDWKSGLSKIGTSLFNGVKNLFDSAITNILETFGVDFGENGTFLGAVTNTIDMLTIKLLGVWNGVTTWVSDKWTGLTDTLKNFWTDLSNFFTNPETEGSIPYIYNSVKTTISNSITDIKNSITGFFTDAYNNVVTNVDAAWTSFTTLANEKITLLTDTITSIPTKVVDWATGFFEWFSNMLPDLGQIAQNIKDAVYDLLPDWVKDNISFGVTAEPTTAQTGVSTNDLANQAAEYDLMQQSLTPFTQMDASSLASRLTPSQLELLGGETEAIRRQYLLQTDPDSVLANEIEKTNQTGSSLTTSEVAEGVRERQAGGVVNNYYTAPTNEAGRGGNGNGGGAYLLPAAPTMDVMDPVSQYFNSN